MVTDEEQIAHVIKNYVEGFNRGDKAKILNAFHPRGVSSGYVGEALQWDSAEDFAEFCAGAAPDPDGAVPPWEIEALHVSGRTAVAIVQDRWGSRMFRDSLTLIRGDDGWRIVFKAFDPLGQGTR